MILSDINMLGMDGLTGFGVELDIHNNGGCGDGSDDHVGVDSLADCSAMSGLPQSLFSTDVTSTLDLAKPPNLHVPPLPYQGLSAALVSRQCFAGSPAPPDVQHLPTQGS